VRFAPKDLDSVTLQLCLLALFFRARSEFETQAGRGRAQRSVAERLRKLAERLRPGSCDEVAPRAREAMPAAGGLERAARARRGKRRKR
jgi:hypothetical protein